jgi:7-cyano-7-deazaguanine reductase
MNAKQRLGAKTDNFRGISLLGRNVRECPVSPDKARLESFENKYPRRNYWIHLECPEFTALCPITRQPDFGVITIDYIPGRRCLESKSLKLYLFSFRNIGAFHEEAVNRILDDLVKTCRPRQARVTGKFNPRGGITIAVTAEYPPPR